MTKNHMIYTSVILGSVCHLQFRCKSLWTVVRVSVEGTIFPLSLSSSLLSLVDRGEREQKKLEERG